VQLSLHRKINQLQSYQIIIKSLINHEKIKLAASHSQHFTEIRQRTIAKRKTKHKIKLKKHVTL